MPSPTSFLHVFRSKYVVLVLLLGNLALGFTAFAQSRVIAGQEQLIRLLYTDSSELANMKIIANRAKKH